MVNPFSSWGEGFSSGILPDSQIKSTSPSCPPVFLPQNVNGLNGPFHFNLWALRGSDIQERISLTLTYSFALFGVSPNTGIQPGPGFSLAKTTVTKGGGFTGLSFTLNRVGEAQPDELVVSITAQAAIGFPIIGSGTLEWTECRVDEGDDLSQWISPVQITRSVSPSKPVLVLPDPITCTTVRANWLPNQESEDVLTYSVSVSDPTVEVASAVVPATQTSVTLGGLSPGKPYILWLTATNAEGESRMSHLFFTTRYESTGSQRRILLEQMPHEWNPQGQCDGTLQGMVPSPADLDLDGRVNAGDALEMVWEHVQ